MLPPLLDKSHPSPADKWLWALLGVLVVGQVVAIWMLCQQQVDKAEVREAVLRAERIALQDSCAPKNGRATCMPADLQRRAGTDVNAVMAALR
jgi:hypothetical protein